ncbi:MAG: type II secretion system F family protein [Candidatus Omnitrophica bacterium]|nr:type II secretion system F family protein [Candidatus Omnitrophota bacterium]
MFTYTARDMSGKIKTDMIEAPNEQGLVDKLQAQGLFIIKVAAMAEMMQEKSVQKPAEAIKFHHDKVKLEDLLTFSRQLATMLEAGVALLRSLNVIIPQVQSRQLTSILKQVRTDVEAGKSLSQSLSKHPKVFGQFWVSLAEVGEASGTMPHVLNKLANHVQEQAEFRSTIISVAIYPAILFTVCIGAVVFFALVVAPRFEEIFTAMHAHLPVMTQVLLAVFKFIKTNLILLLAGGVGGFFVLRAYLSTPQGGLMGERLMFRLPVVGDVVKLIIVERFSSQMAILVDSGVPILLALEITGRLVENQICGSLIARIQEEVRAGKGIADSMAQEGFFPVMAVQMIKVGEETGELAKMLNHVAAYYKSNVEAFVKRFGTIIEPFMLVFMAAVIGVIVVSIFLPLFKLGQGGAPH